MSSAKPALSHGSGTAPIIVFGAFDRHNFGDLLFAHIAAALLPDEPLIFAGLLERDMRGYGGHFVHALADLTRNLRRSPVRILHAGGELLTCSAWEAAVMLHSASGKQDFAASQSVAVQDSWAHAFLGRTDHAPYLLSRTLFPNVAAVVYNAVGGVDLPSRTPALRDEVLRKLAEADELSVRDRHTLAVLRAAGMEARLMPDSAVMLAELFGEKIARHARSGEAAQISAALPQGYLAVQCSANFDQAETLEKLARQLERAAMENACGIVLFRAGAAPWHDSLACCRRLAAHMGKVPVHLFLSLNAGDICALIARSRGYCGSSLHGRIAALAFARPRVNLRHPDQPRTVPTKQESFIKTWEDDCIGGMADIEELESALQAALHVNPARLRDKAAELVTHYRRGVAVLRQSLKAQN